MQWVAFQFAAASVSGFVLLLLACTRTFRAIVKRVAVLSAAKAEEGGAVARKKFHQDCGGDDNHNAGS